MKDGTATGELEVADTIGKLMQFWGFKRPMGRIWTLLYLSPKPLPAADIGAELLMSSGAVSMALSELERWGAVHRTWVPGERRDFFHAEGSVWKLVQRVLRERELALVREFRETLERAELNLTQFEKNHSPDVHLEGHSEGLRYKRARLRRLGELAQTGETLLAALVQGGAIDPTKLLSPTDNQP
jgi:DNA-binding transcriptional regulator GbsR (MarR family)